MTLLRYSYHQQKPDAGANSHRRGGGFHPRTSSRQEWSSSSSSSRGGATTFHPSWKAAQAPGAASCHSWNNNNNNNSSKASNNNRTVGHNKSWSAAATRSVSSSYVNHETPSNAAAAIVQRGPRPHHHHHSWRRPPQPQGNDIAKECVVSDACAGTKSLVPNNSVDEDSAAGSTNKDEPALLHGINNETEKHLKQATEHSKNEIQGSESTGDKAVSELNAAQAEAHSFMKKQGMNKLVRCDVSHVHDPAIASKEEQQSTTTYRQACASPSKDSSSLRKVGANKLVQTHSHSRKKLFTSSLAASIIANAFRGRKRRSNTETFCRPVAKRVKLSDETSADESDTKSKTSVSDGAKREKLTDFAYRETCTILPKSHRSNGSSRHMGLVRVPPDQTITPICPTFLQGFPCTDPLCTKRHDVPKEAATPICSFFQRHGQCLKGTECPFRHIKVNSRAEPCPSFGRLGFCPNPDCSLKHVYSKKPRARAE